MSGAGILGAMLQGLGKGSIENIEQMRKEAEINKQLDWREKEAEKTRQAESDLQDKKHLHELGLENLKHQNKITEAAYTAKVNAKYNNNAMSEKEKDFLSVSQTLGIYDQKIEALRNARESTDSQDQIKMIDDQLKALQKHRMAYLNSPNTINSLKATGAMGRAYFISNDGDLDAWELKLIDSKSETKATSSSLIPPASDLQLKSSDDLQRLADKKRDQELLEQRMKARQHDLNWAREKLAYKPSIFGERTF